MYGSIERPRRSGRHPANVRFYASVALAGIFVAGCSSPSGEPAPSPAATSASADTGGNGGGVPAGALAAPQPTTNNKTGGRGGFDAIACDGFTTNEVLDGFFEVHPKIRGIGNVDLNNIYTVSIMWATLQDVNKGQMMLGLAAPGDMVELTHHGGYLAAAISIVDFTPVPKAQRPKHIYDVTLPLAPQFKDAVVIPCDNGDGQGNVLNLAGPADE